MNKTNPLTQLFIDSYDGATLERIFVYKGKRIHSAQIIRAISDLYPLFAFDPTNYVRDYMLDKICNKYAKGWADPNISYYMLFSRDIDKAKRYLHQHSEQFIKTDGMSYYLNLCTVYYYEDHLKEFWKVLNHVSQLSKEEPGKRRYFMETLESRVNELDYWGVKKKKAKLLNEASMLLGVERYSDGGYYSGEDEFIMTQKRTEAENLNTRAYEYAKAYDYASAMDAIDRAISLCPGEANFYESKGEIFLMQGKEEDALLMWKEVIKLSPRFVEEYPDSKLYHILKERYLIE